MKILKPHKGGRLIFVETTRLVRKKKTRRIYGETNQIVSVSKYFSNEAFTSSLVCSSRRESIARLARLV